MGLVRLNACHIHSGLVFPMLYVANQPLDHHVRSPCVHRSIARNLYRPAEASLHGPADLLNPAECLCYPCRATWPLCHLLHTCRMLAKEVDDFGHSSIRLVRLAFPFDYDLTSSVAYLIIHCPTPYFRTKSGTYGVASSVSSDSLALSMYTGIALRTPLRTHYALA